MLTRPRRLRRGDRLAAVSPSWGGPAVHPLRYEVGKRQLEETFGVDVVEMPHTLAPPEKLAADPLARVDDLHRAFADPDIAGVVSTIGGDDSIRLLPHLDLDLLADNPKVFCGYSDVMTIQMALLQAGVTSFFGPAVLSGFGENAGLHRYLVEGVRTMLFEPQRETVWPVNHDGWTVAFTDWDDPEEQQRPRPLTPNPGWRWYGSTATEGPTLVACFEVLDFLRGTRWWPDLTGAVLLLETSEEAPAPDAVARFLRILAVTGELQQLAGIVLGRPGGFELPVADHEAYDQAVLQVVYREENLTHLPVVCGVDFGHTDPMWTVPQGVMMRVDPERRTLTFLEAAVL